MPIAPTFVGIIAEATTITLNHTRLTGALALILGLLILVFPRFLAYLVAFYLVVLGVVSILNLHF